MSAAILKISDATRAFTGHKAIVNVSLQLDSGEIVALLGPNGAGKTTLIRAITGRLALDSGLVRVAGFDPLKDPRARRSLGIVPQSIALYPQLTGRQNLDVFARLMGVKGSERKAAVELALERADLIHRADDFLSELSGGMQRRLNIVAATLHGPKLLLLDEPTVGVDLHAREKIQALLRDLSGAGMGILFSTHDFEQAASLADRAAIMVAGRLLRLGAIDELIAEVFGGAREGVVSLAAPATKSVAAILRAARMQPTRNNSLWSGPLQGGYTELANIEAELERAGTHAAEISLRDPGLSGVFVQLMAEAEVA